MHNLEKFLHYVIQLGMKDRFVWVSGTPYEKKDTNWGAEGRSTKESGEKGLLRGTGVASPPTSSIFTDVNAAVGRRSTQSLSRWYRTFLSTKQLCQQLGIAFLDIFHPLSGPDFEALRIPGDVHKKRFVWRAKAALLLQGLAESFAETGDPSARSRQHRDSATAARIDPQQPTLLS